MSMESAKKELLKIIKDIPENQILEVIDFVEYLKLKNKKELYKDLEEASNSSTDFWNNDIDDEVWNDA
jgi:hypothetical protein